MSRISAMAGSMAILVLAMQPVSAGSLAPEERAFHGKPEVSDTSLADMRGRFITADQILYFGVEMYTGWNSAGQQVGAAALNIGIDRSGPRPTVSVSSHVQTPSNGNGSGAPSSQIGSGGLDQVQGVSQLVQVTGNGNRITNTADVCVGDQCPALAPLTATGGNHTVMNPQTGVTAQTYVDRSGAGVRVSVANQGVASQSFASMTGIQQRAQVSGDALTIHNQLNMVIQLQANSTTAPTGLRGLPQTMHGLWQAGIR